MQAKRYLIPSLGVAIVDDEPLARRRLERMLQACEGVKLVGVASDVEEAARLAERGSVDVVIADVVLRGSNGIDLARKLASSADAPVVILISAFNHFGAEAFEIGAIDYLLKPVSLARLAEALERARRERQARTMFERVAELETIVDRLRGGDGRERPGGGAAIWVRSGSAHERIAVADIGWIEAERDYVRIHAGGRRYLVRSSLTAFEQQFGKFGFVRVHRSALVRAAAVVSVRPDGDSSYKITLADGAAVGASRRFRSNVNEIVRSAR